MRQSTIVTRKTGKLWLRGLSSVSQEAGGRNAKVFKPSHVNPPLPSNHFEFQTVVELQEKACKAFPRNPVLGTNKGYHFEWITYLQLDDEIQKFRNVLGSMNFKCDDKLAIISNNRVEWAAVLYATLSLGGQIVPMYENQLEKDWKYIVEDSDAKVLVVANGSIYQKVKDYVGKVGKVESIVVFDGEEDQPNSYKSLMEIAAASSVKPVPSLSTTIDPDHLCAIIYTSGTTGSPKGVELSHINITSGIYGLKQMNSPHTLFPCHTSLAFLPWAHIYGMATELCTLLSTGSGLAIVPHRDVILECLSIVKPTTMYAVPALLNKIYDQVQKNVAKKSLFKQAIVRFALKTARVRNSLLEQRKPVSDVLEWKYQLMDKLALSSIRTTYLGGRLQYINSGGAAISLPVQQFFEDIGVPVLDSYGLTEVAPAVTGSSVGWGRRRLGTVGEPLLGQSVRIISAMTEEEVPLHTEGEITCAGPNVMRGYHNNPTATAEAFYEHEGQRYFRTGDMGRMVEEKFLKITGRIKEQFKLENGKYVVPAPMEDVLGRSPFISQIFVYGNNKPYTIALLVPNMVEVTDWVNHHHHRELAPLLPTAKQMAGAAHNTIALFNHPTFVHMINEELHRTGAQLMKYEKPYRWVAILRPFTVENQLLSPKLSLRRNNIVAHYQWLIDKMYEGKAGHDIEGEVTKRNLGAKSFNSVVRVLKKYPFSKHLLFLDVIGSTHFNDYFITPQLFIYSVVIKSEEVSSGIEFSDHFDVRNIQTGDLLLVTGVFQDVSEEKNDQLVNAGIWKKKCVFVRSSDGGMLKSLSKWDSKSLGLFTYEESNFLPCNATDLNQISSNSIGVPTLVLQAKNKSCEKALELLRSLYPTMGFRESALPISNSKDRLILCFQDNSTDNSNNTLQVSKLTNNDLLSQAISRVYPINLKSFPHIVHPDLTSALFLLHQRALTLGLLLSDSSTSNTSAVVVVRVQSYPRHIAPLVVATLPTVHWSPTGFTHILSVVLVDAMWMVSLVERTELMIGDIYENNNKFGSKCSGGSAGNSTDLEAGTVDKSSRVCKSINKLHEILTRNDWIYDSAADSDPVCASSEPSVTSATISSSSNSITSSSSYSNSSSNVSRPMHAYGLCLDVGSSPGGWSTYLARHVSVQRVISVDKGVMNIDTALINNPIEHWQMLGQEAVERLREQKESGSGSGSGGGDVQIDLYCCDANIAPVLSTSLLVKCVEYQLLSEGARFVLTLKNTLGKQKDWLEAKVTCIEMLQKSFVDVREVNLLANTPKETTVTGVYKTNK